MARLSSFIGEAAPIEVFDLCTSPHSVGPRLENAIISKQRGDIRRTLSIYRVAETDEK
jgi:hypothetical protein